MSRAQVLPNDSLGIDVLVLVSSTVECINERTRKFRPVVLAMNTRARLVRVLVV